MTDGLQLGRYELRERIGKGGTATVYKAWDTMLERWVAVKVLHDYLAEDADFRSRFEREAKLVAGLNHPNIVQVYDFGMKARLEGTAYYMVLPFIEGASLRSRMESAAKAGQRLALREVLDIMRGVCSALSYAHQKGMVHRDVTPGNVLFTPDGHVVLADFGIAKLIGGTRLTQTGTTSGTPVYMAPEQGIGESADTRADVYSVGVILFEMLTGKPPYDGDSAYAILMKHVSAPVPSLLEKAPDLPPALELVVRRALEKEPERRYPTIDMLFAELERAVGATRPGGGSMETTRLPLLTADLVPPSRRRASLLRFVLPALIIVAVASVLALSALTQYYPNVPAQVTLAIAPVTTRTYAPSMTASPLIFTESFDDEANRLEWTITTDDPDVYRNIEDGVYRVRHTLRAVALTSLLYEEHVYGFDYMYEADFTISPEGQPDSAAGLVFRYRSDDRYYVFAVNGQGQVSIWSRFDGEWQELRGGDTNWTPAESARPAGETNRLRVIDNGRRLMGYVNEVLVIDVTSEPLVRSGAIGVYLASSALLGESEPFAEVDVDNFRTAQYRAPTATP